MAREEESQSRICWIGGKVGKDEEERNKRLAIPRAQIHGQSDAGAPWCTVREGAGRAKCKRGVTGEN